MSAKDFLKELAQQLAREGLETWLGMNEQFPMEQKNQAYLVYQIGLYLQTMNAEAAQRLAEIPY